MRNLKAHLLYVFSNDFRIALGIAIVIRLAVFLITAAVPITADSGNLVSPTIAYGTDLTFYQDRKNVLISKSMGDLVKEYFSFPTKIRGMVAGSLFPILLHFFGYRSGNSLPMAILFLVGSFVLVDLWLRWLYRFAQWLNHGGLLIICIPTENYIYRIGRKVFGFIRPSDHHFVQPMRPLLERYFRWVLCRYWPLPFSALSQFHLICGRK